jgi:transcriptional regulator with XRE-family HTH domain
VNGKTTPSLDTLYKIADATGIKIYDFFRAKEDLGDLTAIIVHRDRSYIAHTIDELEAAVNDLRAQSQT